MKPQLSNVDLAFITSELPEEQRRAFMLGYLAGAQWQIDITERMVNHLSAAIKDKMKNEPDISTHKLVLHLLELLDDNDR